MGMMTLVRVLPPELYEKIMELKKKERREESDHQHSHKP
jgi:hypothetical protein